jgi:hypothetical protein
MFGPISNLIFLLIPLAIFIGRMVIEARKKGEGQSRIPVHFEDEKETVKKPQVPIRKPVSASKSSASSSKTAYKPVFKNPVPQAEPASRANTAGTAPGATLPPGISRLSPLKQAVVMSEVLGTPKGLL